MPTIRTTRVIDAPPKEVWDVLVDFASHERWNPFFASIQGMPSVGEELRVVLRDEDGEGMTFRPTVLEAEAGRVLRWRGRLFLPGIFTGTHWFELRELDAGSSTELVHGESFRGILVPFLGRVLRDTEAGFVRLNDALAAEVESRSCRSGSASLER